MIRITKGTFGWFDGRRVVPLTAADGPVELDRELERRLVEEEGIAAFVESGDRNGKPAEVIVPAEDARSVDDLYGLTKAELVDFTVKNGIELPAKATKAAILSAIRGE